MEIYLFFLALALTIFVGFMAHYLFRRFRAPDVLILIGLGYLFGPRILGVVDTTVTDDLALVTPFVAAMALAIIMFDAGMDLNFREAVLAFPRASAITIAAFTLSMLCTAIICIVVLGWSTLDALLLGAILGGTSGAIVIPLVSHMEVLKETKITVTLEAALTDVLVVAVASAVLVIIGTGNGSLPGVLPTLVITFLISSIIGMLAGLIWLRVLSLLARQPFSYMITLAALLTIFSVTEMVLGGGGGAIAALVFGLVLGNHEYLERKLGLERGTFSRDEEIKGFHSQITFFVRTFFFVYLGVVISVMSLGWMDLALGFTIFSSLVLVRWVIMHASDPQSNRPREDRLALWFMMPRGLAAAVLASVPLTAMGIGSEVGSIILGVTTIVILLTTIFASLGAFYIERSTNRRTAQKHKLKFGPNNK